MHIIGILRIFNIVYSWNYFLKFFMELITIKKSLSKTLTFISNVDPSFVLKYWAIFSGYFLRMLL